MSFDDISLRPWQDTDVSMLVEAYSDPSIQRWHARSMTEEEARTWLRSWPKRWVDETGCGWAIADHSRLFGQISLRRLNLSDGIGELSYWVVPAARGQRVATRAVSALSAWAFEELHLHRLEIAHSTLNPASCRVAVNAGFVFEAIKRSEGLHSDGWHDMHLHARLDDDPAPGNVGRR